MALAKRRAVVLHKQMVIARPNYESIIAQLFQEIFFTDTRSRDAGARVDGVAHRADRRRRRRRRDRRRADLARWLLGRISLRLTSVFAQNEGDALTP